MIQNKMLNAYEKSWLEKMLSLDFVYRNDIVKQINQATILREYTNYYLRLNFIPASNEQSQQAGYDLQGKGVPESTGVPVEMRVFFENKAPIQFLLHIEKGIVSELEVFYADSSKIDSEISLDNAQIEIIIDPV